MKEVKELTPEILSSIGPMNPFKFISGMQCLEEWCKTKHNDAVVFEGKDYTLCYLRHNWSDLLWVT